MMDYFTNSETKAKLFVGQIPREIIEDELRAYFTPFGILKEVSIIRDPLSGLSRGCAFVTYVEKSAADAAVEALHNVVQLPSSPNPLQVRFAETPLDRENKVFVGMLPKTYCESDLNDMFSVFGDLKEIHIIKSQDGSPKGCAFVKYFVKDAAAAAIEALNETIPQGATRPIVVKFAETKKIRSDTFPVDCAQKDHWTPSSSSATPRSGQQYNDQPFIEQMSNLTPGYRCNPTVLMTPQDSIHYGADMNMDVYQHQFIPQALRPPEGPNGANLFVYHLPRDITDADLATLFAPFGNVISAKVFVDKKTADSKGFGFVSYDSFDSANFAIEAMNGFQIGSKRLKVQHKRIMPSFSPQAFSSTQPRGLDHNGLLISTQELDYSQPYVNYPQVSNPTAPADFSGYHQMGFDRY